MWYDGTNLKFRISSTTHTLAPAAGGSGLTIGTTTITSGTDKHVLYDNAGVLGEAAPLVITDANTVEQYNGTNPQRFDVYNTRTDASNYERLNVVWSGNVCFIGPTAAGTGTNRNVVFVAGTGASPVCMLSGQENVMIFSTDPSVTAISGVAIAGYPVQRVGDAAAQPLGFAASNKNSTGYTENAYINNGGTAADRMSTGVGGTATTDIYQNRGYLSAQEGLDGMLIIAAATGGDIKFSTGGVSGKWLMDATGDFIAQTTVGITVGTAAALVATNVALSNGAGASLGTLANAPAAGDPTKWIPINDNGTTRHVPAW
jgi:hypothetical protein